MKGPPNKSCHPTPVERVRECGCRWSGVGALCRSTLMTVLRILALCVALHIACARADIPLSIGDGIIVTSLVRVVASPKEYADKRIMLKGYYMQGVECSGLFLSKDDARIYNGQQGLWIGAAKEGCKVEFPRKGFVVVTGIFRYAKDRGAGHMGEFLGEIVDVESIRLIK